MLTATNMERKWSILTILTFDCNIQLDILRNRGREKKQEASQQPSDFPV